VLIAIINHATASHLIAKSFCLVMCTSLLCTAEFLLLGLKPQLHEIHKPARVFSIVQSVLMLPCTPS